MKNKPATALPWATEFIGVSDAGPNGVDVFDIGPCDKEGAMRKRVATVAGDDAAYIAHAANAYPELVEALREARTTIWHMSKDDGPLAKQVERIDALFRKLKETA